jgi:hypothetical protein
VTKSEIIHGLKQNLAGLVRQFGEVKNQRSWRHAEKLVLQLALKHEIDCLRQAIVLLETGHEDQPI